MPSKEPVTSANTAGSPEPESFETLARKMLECALARHAEDRPLAAPEIRECVKGVTAHAKSRGIHAERMLIELKRTWYTIAESGVRPKSEVISPLVTMCIKEFYGEMPDLPDD